MATTEIPPVPIDPASGWPVWGQPSAIGDLERALERGLGHAWLFTGPAGSGRLSAAIAFAKALCCSTSRSGLLPCGECSHCLRADRGLFPDITRFSLATQAERDGEKSRNLTLNIATVREISAALSFRPSESSWRVAIVEDAETMQETAQESFLKTLEEPPPYAIIVLISKDAESILPTVTSRTTPVRFGPVPAPAIRDALAESRVADDVAEHLSLMAGGSVGWALHASVHPELAEEREALQQSARDMVMARPYDRMVKAIHLADRFLGNREDVFAYLAAVQVVWREVLYTVAGVPLLQSDPALTDRFVSASTDAIVGSANSVGACIENLGANVRPRLALETMVQRWVN